MSHLPDVFNAASVSVDSQVSINSLVSPAEIATATGLNICVVQNYIRENQIAPAKPRRYKQPYFYSTDVLLMIQRAVKPKARTVPQHIQEEVFARMGGKRCSRCQEDLPLDSFRQHTRYSGGRIGICTPCSNRAGSEHYQANKQRKNELRKVWRANNPEKTRAHRKASYQRNKAQNHAYHAAWVDRNRAYVNAKMVEWRSKNKEYHSAYGRARHRASKALADRLPQGDKVHKACNSRVFYSLFLEFLALYSPCKRCETCCRLHRYEQFDRDGRTSDGWTKSCLSCLPPLHNPRGGMRSLDTSANPESDGLIAYTQDVNATDPEKLVMAGLLRDWIANDLPENLQQFLSTFEESDFDLSHTATVLQVEPSVCMELLESVREQAMQEWEGVYA